MADEGQPRTVQPQDRFDTEYQATDNGAEFVHCLCAIDEATGQEWRLRISELQKLDDSYTGDDTLLITYAGAAEMDASVQ